MFCHRLRYRLIGRSRQIDQPAVGFLLPQIIDKGFIPRQALYVDLHAIKVPRHILYSPEGHMLFIKTGTMTGAEIRQAIEQRGSAWNRWKKTGEIADWMRP